MSDDVKTEVQLQLSPTHQAIRELKDYHSFSFTHSLLSARDMYKHENRAIGVFTSGDDAPGSIQWKLCLLFSAQQHICLVLYSLYGIACSSICPSVYHMGGSLKNG